MRLSIGKGDLVGCDISLNLMHNGQQLNTGGVGQGGQDFILKSSSDVKVGQSILAKLTENQRNDETCHFSRATYRH
jgi:hypothetical protein